MIEAIWVRNNWSVVRNIHASFCFCGQFANGVGAVLCHHHPAQPAAAPGRLQDGCETGRRPAKDGGSASAQQQRQVPGHHHRLSADPRLWQPGEQGTLGGDTLNCPPSFPLLLSLFMM